MAHYFTGSTSVQCLFLLLPVAGLEAPKPGEPKVELAPKPGDPKVAPAPKPEVLAPKVVFPAPNPAPAPKVVELAPKVVLGAPKAGAAAGTPKEEEEGAGAREPKVPGWAAEVRPRVGGPVWVLGRVTSCSSSSYSTCS